MSLVVLNDVHIGVSRSAGTTPATQWQLRQHLLSEFKRLLPAGKDVLINGDLFDTAHIPFVDVLKTYEILADWLAANPTNTLYNSAGNHDLSKTSTVLSSFQFLGKLLQRQFPGQYVHIEESTLTPYGYVIPHYANQVLFDIELDKVPECKVVFLHCNYDNGFAAQSDQSLNLSKEQADKLPCEKVVIAHEHHPRMVGKVVIPGNQVSSSVSDWQQEGDKGYVEVDVEGNIARHTSAVKADEFVEMRFTDLEITEHKFVRVVGRIAGADSAQVITSINRLRQKHPAFVITNAVEIITDDVKSVVTQSIEAATTFDVMGSLKDIFTEEEYAILLDVQNK